MTFVLAGCFLLTLPNGLVAQELKLTAATWPPYIGTGLPNEGLAADIVTTALARAGYRPRLIIEDVGRTIEGTLVGQYDVIASLWHSPQRAEKLAFSEPYLYNQVKFIKRQEANIVFNDLGDLSGAVIGVVKGYAYGEAFEQADQLIKVASNHLIQNLIRVLQDDIDLTLGDQRVLEYEIDNYLGANRTDLEVLPKPLTSNGLHIAVSKTRPDHEKIIADFNRMVAEMRADGTYGRILERHAPPGSSR
jgi:polar amino acid transport system substrate-binding protein